MKKRLLTGIKPTGTLHLGNYFGVFKPTISKISSGEFDSFVFLANLHALNSTPKASDLSGLTYNLALDLLSLGLDPEQCVLFAQGDVKEHTDLTWVLLNLVNIGMLERSHAFKDAVENKGVLRNEVNLGLFTYPILMAADIILYEPDFVPVGQDQIQHVEIARDLVNKMNSNYGTKIKLPEVMLEDNLEIVQGIDGRKMSKSYDNYIPVFSPTDKPNMVKKRIMSIQTDSKSVEDVKDPLTCNIYKIYELFATEQQQDNMRDKYLAGGFGYGDAKKELLQVYEEYFAEANERRKKLLENPESVRDVLREGSVKATSFADKFMKEVNKKIGLNY